jgi:hypothetical protein
MILMEFGELLIFPKIIFSLANSSKLKGKWNLFAVLRYCVEKWDHLAVWMLFLWFVLE